MKNRFLFSEFRTLQRQKKLIEMNGLSWSALAIILVVCHVTIAAPSPLRVKREEELSLDPVSSAVSRINERFITDDINW